MLDIVALYDRLMAVEEKTGCRFGVRLAWTPCRTPSYPARFTLLVGVGMALVL
jgi:hypothetical protein